MKKTTLVLLFSLMYIFSNAQDSTVYVQKDAAMFSNTYIFFSDGTFKHYYTTDDVQLWYGEGDYSDNGKHRTLYFRDADATLNDYEGWTIHYETHFQRVFVKKQFGFKSVERRSDARKRRLKLQLKRT